MKQQPTPIFLLGKFHGQRSLAGYSPWGHKESDTEWPSTQAHTLLRGRAPSVTLSLLRKAPTQAQSAGDQPLPWLWSLDLSSIVNSLPYTSNLFKPLGLEKDLAFSWLPSVVSKLQVLPLRKSFSFLSLLLHCPLPILPRSFTVSCKHQVALMVKNPLANTGDIRDTGSIPGLGRSLGDGHSNSSILAWRIPMDRGAWWATGHSVVESDTTEAT